MTDYFVDDGGDGTDGLTWAKAEVTFAAGVAHLTAGDRLIVGHDHTESIGSSTFAFSTTRASPNIVISATSTAGGAVVTYNKADNVQLAGTGAADITITGFVELYGLSLRAGDDMIFNATNNRLLYDDCLLEFTGTSSVFALGSSNGQHVLTFKNTDVNWSNSTGGTGSGFRITAPTIFNWNGGTLSYAGSTQPTVLFSLFDRATTFTCAGVDLSAITSALVSLTSGSDIQVQFRHCLLNSGVALTTGAIASKGVIVLNDGSDDSTGNDLYRLDLIDYFGSTVHDDAIYRNDGASDGTNNISWKMVTTTNAIEFGSPTVSPPIYSWVDATGSTTFTVSIVWDSASDLQNDEVWLEIEYLESSADTDTAFADDRMADVAATPADQTNNTETWTGTGGFGTANKVEVSVTATVNRVGPVIGRVHLAKPSTTIYVDPLMVKS